ncbi:MAG: hypothetical protein WAU78_11545 [Roseiarcus sp.]|jgi:hypothetical protein
MHPAMLAFRYQILVAYGSNSYWKEWTERGNPIYNRGVNVTAERLDEFRRKRSLAALILDASPNVEFLDLNFDMADDDQN